MLKNIFFIGVFTANIAYSDEPIYYPEVIMTNPRVSAACPTEESVWAFDTALSEQNKQAIELYITQFGCLPILAESHGAVIDTSPTMLKIRWNYLYKYPSQPKPELWIKPKNLREIGDRSKTVYDLLK